MNRRELDKIWKLIADPPAGSQIAAAKNFGVDLTLVAQNLMLTPTERLRKLYRAQCSVEGLRGSRKR